MCLLSDNVRWRTVYVYRVLLNHCCYSAKMKILSMFHKPVTVTRQNSSFIWERIAPNSSKVEIAIRPKMVIDRFTNLIYGVVSKKDIPFKNFEVTKLLFLLWFLKLIKVIFNEVLKVIEFLPFHLIGNYCWLAYRKVCIIVQIFSDFFGQDCLRVFAFFTK